MKNTKNRTVMPPPTANHVVEFSVAASFLYLADIIERFCDLLSNSVKKEANLQIISVLLSVYQSHLAPGYATK